MRPVRKVELVHGLADLNPSFGVLQGTVAWPVEGGPMASSWPHGRLVLMGGGVHSMRKVLTGPRHQLNATVPYQLAWDIVGSYPVVSFQPQFTWHDRRLWCCTCKTLRIVLKQHGQCMPSHDELKLASAPVLDWCAGDQQLESFHLVRACSRRPFFCRTVVGSSAHD